MKKKFVFNENNLKFETEKPKIIKKIIFYVCLVFSGVIIGFFINKNQVDNIRFMYNDFKAKEQQKDYTIGSEEWKDSTFKMYEKRADVYLKKVRTPIKPAMLSLAAYNVYDSLGILVPLELVLAQATLESSMGTKGKSPINNPFNVGEYDSGTVLWFENTFDGIQSYYFLIAKNYLKCKSLNTLLKNFTNCNGKRYASSLSYEVKLTNEINKIRRKIDNNLIESGINKF
jgi:hypothetical protein